MPTRSGLVGKTRSGLHLGPFQVNFSMGQKMQTHGEFLSIFLDGPMGPISPVWGHLVIFGRAGSSASSVADAWTGFPDRTNLKETKAQDIQT